VYVRFQGCTANLFSSGAKVLNLYGLLDLFHVSSIIHLGTTTRKEKSVETTKKDLPFTALSKVFNAGTNTVSSFHVLCIMAMGMSALLIIFACLGDEIGSGMKIITSILFSVLFLAHLRQHGVRIGVLESTSLSVARNYCDDHIAHENERFEHDLERARGR